MGQDKLRQEWDSLDAYASKTAREKVKAVLARRGKHPNRSELEELTGEAIAFCWKYFVELRPKCENAKQAVLIAAKQAARAVSRGERFVADSQGRCSVKAQAADDLDTLPCQSSAQVPSDYSTAERIISALPDRLRGIARLLAYGDTVESIAHKQGKHPKTIERNIREMREYIKPGYWHLWSALFAALQQSQ